MWVCGKWTFAVILNKRIDNLCCESISTKLSAYFVSPSNKCCLAMHTIPLFLKQPPEVFCKKGIFRNFLNFTGKHLCQSLFFIKLQSWSQKLYWKRDSSTAVFLWILRNGYSPVELQCPRNIQSIISRFWF